MKTNVTSLLFMFAFWLTGSAQQITNEHKVVVDSLTQLWNNPNAPGGGIAIIQNNEVVFQNVLGIANLDEEEKLTLQTPFLLGQVSDSFIAFAILQMHYQGKLSLEDSVRQYISSLSHLPNNLKVKHLLQQSSGIQDFEILKNISGWPDNKSFSYKNALDLIKTQTTLAFQPGTEYATSRSNIFLAAMIIEKVMNVPLDKAMKQLVFDPLNMKNTFVLTSQNQSQNLLSASYRQNEDGSFERIISQKQNYASVNIATSIEDMAVWEKNLISPSKETMEAVNHFHNYVILNDGTYYGVPQGRLIYGQRYIHKERGINTVMSTGGIDGFASAIFNFPSQNFTVVTLSNNGMPYNGYIGMLSAHEILDDAFTEPTSVDFSKIKTISLNQDYHKQFEGMYWDALGELSRELRIENDTLRYVRPSGVKSSFVHLSNDRFQMISEFDDKVYLNFSKNGDEVIMNYEFGESNPIPFIKYEVPAFTKKEIEKYTGNYYCQQLNVALDVTVNNNKLIGKRSNSENISFTSVSKEIFEGDQWYMGSIKFDINNQGTVDGFYVKNDAIRNLWFKKRK